MRTLALAAGLGLLLSLPSSSFARDPEGVTDPKEALREAASQYDRGEYEESLQWIDRAYGLVEAKAGEIKIVVQSNAGSLLDYLDYYRDYAYGKNAELDAQYEEISGLLERVYDVDKRGGTVSSLGDDSVSYYGTSKLVSWIGDLSVTYSGNSNRISWIGSHSISYYGTSDRPSWIGGISFSYAGTSDELSWVAGESVD